MPLRRLPCSDTSGSGQSISVGAVVPADAFARPECRYGFEAAVANISDRGDSNGATLSPVACEIDGTPEASVTCVNDLELVHYNRATPDWASLVAPGSGAHATGSLMTDDLCIPWVTAVRHSGCAGDVVAPSCCTYMDELSAEEVAHTVTSNETAAGDA